MNTSLKVDFRHACRRLNSNFPPKFQNNPLLVSHDYAKSPLMEAEDSNSSMASAKAAAATAAVKPEGQGCQEQDVAKKEEKVREISFDYDLFFIVIF